MTDNNFQLQLQPPGDPDFEKLINRMCRAGWIDSVVERSDRALKFHFTKVGKERFRPIYQIMQELRNEEELMNAAERSELLAIVEAWIQDVEKQGN